MTHSKTFLIAAPVALALAFSPAAHANGYHGGGGRGAWGFFAGLGAAAVVGGVVAASRPPVYYAPAPVYYAPYPAYYYAPAPVYYAPAPAYAGP
jgi:hypothetical protein